MSWAVLWGAYGYLRTPRSKNFAFASLMSHSPLLITQEPTVPGKECGRCNLFKQATEFYRNKTNPDGLYSHCKACYASYA